MNSNEDQHLALAIGRELKALPELTAPASVSSRVMAIIERGLNIPWYRRSWETWPVILRAASFAGLLALFGALCFAGWELSRTEAVTQTMQQAAQCSSGFNSLLGILINSAVLVMKQLGTQFIIACLVSTGLSYVLFLGLGTVYFRLAFSRRQPSHL